MSITIKNSWGREIPLDVGQYPDKTPVVDLEDAWNASWKPDYMIVKANSLDEFVTAMMVADSFAERGGKVKNLILPYVPGARQDRTKWEGDWLLTLKFVANMINDRNFDTVTILDPHSLVTDALIHRVVIRDDLLSHAFHGIKGYAMPDAIIAPDLGAVKRAESAAKVFGVPVYQATKRRDPQTNKLDGFRFVDPLIPTKRYLVVDDICDAGGTFLGLAQEAQNVYGVTLDLFVTHGLFTKGTDELLKAYDSITTTDSLDYSENRQYVNIFSVVAEMAGY